MNYHDTKIEGMAFRCRADSALGFEFVDERSKLVTGYNSVELVETGLLALPDLIPPADRGEVRHLIQNGITRRGSFAIPFELFTKDRNPAEGILIGKGIFSGPLNLTAIEGYILRIQTTGDNQSTTKDLLPYDIWQQMLDHTDDIVAYIGLEGMVRYITPSVVRILGYQRDKVIGSEFSILLIPDEKNRFEDVRQRAHSTGSSESTARFIGMDAGGARVPFLVRLFASRGSDEGVILIASPEHVEKTITIPVNDLYQAVCAASPVPFIITGKGDRQILMVNDVFLKLTGWHDAKEVFGLSLTDAGLQTSDNEFHSIEQVLDQNGAYEGIQTEYRTPAGIIPILLSARTFVASGHHTITWSLVPLQSGHRI